MQNYLKGREMRRVVKDEKSEWKEVKSVVPHWQANRFLGVIKWKSGDSDPSYNSTSWVTGLLV